MKTNMIKLGALFAGMVLTTACSGGSAGTSSATTRAVTGQLQQSNAALMKAAVDDCIADAVIATASDAATTSASVASDCSFSMDLAVDKSYVLSFLNGGNFVATLVFDTGSGDTGSAMGITTGSTDVDLGTITITGSAATPANNPLDYCDSDDDGDSDYDDSDDDNDGRDDSLEDDCDFDGYVDDYDDDCSCRDDSREGEYIYRVRPTDDGEGVDLDEDVKAYATCPINPDTVDETTFIVEDSLGSAIVCNYSESNDDDEGDDDSSQGEFRCRHDDDPFADNTVYTVTIDGVTCMDGTSLDSVTWAFDTGSGSDDDSDDEDDEEDDDSNDD